MPPNNDSGHGRGQYASPAQVRHYLDQMCYYLECRNAAWLDRNTDAHGNIREGVKDLCNRWQADNRILEVAIREGWLDPASMPDPKGQKNNQIGRYTAIVYGKSPEGRRLVAFALKDHLDRLEREQSESLARKEASWA